jgi:YNFM family putative membrane transporter
MRADTAAMRAPIQQGTAIFRRTNLAMFAAGVATFSLLYGIQPLMPEFSRFFGVSAAVSSLCLSLTSGILAVALLFAGALSDAWGRKTIMAISLFSSALLMLLTAVSPDWRSILILSSLLGLTLSGVPAVAMAYLSEEIDPESLGLAMGLYISGSAIGGMAGRLLVGVLTDACGWRIGVATLGATGLLAAALFAKSLPPSQHFISQRGHLRLIPQKLRELLTDAGMPLLFAEGFVLLGGFVTLYNYIGYRLMAPPYGLSQAAVGLIFSVYLVGTFSSTWIGHLAGRLGRRKVLWTMFVLMLTGVMLTLFASLWIILMGIVVATFGFFGGHSIVSSWVGRRAGNAKAHASSLYLFTYYVGSSVAGSLGGLFYTALGWTGVAEFVAGIWGFGLIVAWRLAYLQPLPRATVSTTALP